MNLINSLIIIPCIAVALAGLGMKVKAHLHPLNWHKVQMKPIDCAFCLAFWIGVTYDFSIEGILFALAGATIAGKIDNL